MNDTSHKPDIRLVIDREWQGITVYIKSARHSDEVEGIMTAINAYSESVFPSVIAYLGEKLEILPQRRIVRLYVENRRVKIETLDQTYDARKTLRELEEILDPARFVRISKSETINVRKVKQFDFSAAGTIGVELANGELTWVARRRIRDVKKLIERGGKG